MGTMTLVVVAEDMSVPDTDTTLLYLDKSIGFSHLHTGIYQSYADMFQPHADAGSHAPHLDVETGSLHPGTGAFQPDTGCPCTDADAGLTATHADVDRGSPHLNSNPLWIIWKGL